MSNQTPNYNLIKPTPEEFYDVSVQNGNMDKIDAALKLVADGAMKTVIVSQNYTDFNNLYENNSVVLYQITAYGATLQNAPSANNGLLISNGIGNKSQTYITTGTNAIYKRVGTGSWSRFYAEDYKPTASDVGARPDTWTPSAADVGAVPVQDMKTQNPDFNSLFVSGKVTMYEVSSCAESDVSLYHRPVYNAGVLITNGIGSRSQLFVQSGSESMWRRWGSAEGSWNAWVMVYDTAHKPSASDVGATPAAHASAKNNPHSVTAAQVGALPIGGGDLSGNVSVKTASYPSVTLKNTNNQQTGQMMLDTAANGLVIQNKTNDDDQNRVLLVLPNKDAALSDMLHLYRIVNGAATKYDVYHTGNKPSASDVGAVPVFSATGNADFNTLFVSGKVSMYECAASTISIVDTHRPVTNAGVLITNGIGSLSQLFMQSGGNGMWRRWGTVSGGTVTWRDWVEVGSTKMVSGSYVGTNTWGANNPTTLTLPIVPKILMIFSTNNVYNPEAYGDPNKDSDCAVLNFTGPTAKGAKYYMGDRTYGGTLLKYSLNGTTASWYLRDSYADENSAQFQYNAADHTYYWVAIG